MSQEGPSIRHISDTARWAAVYRARESERPDALFRDPFARRMAGKRGEEIAASLPFHEKNSWSWVTRTWLFDEFIKTKLGEGADAVVNLAAGLDARPYRMALPARLKWFEVDLPEILDYKEEILGAEKPVCTLERIRMDLADVSARRALFERIGSVASKVLVLSEGLIIYLTTEEAGALAEDLARPRSFQSWATDLASPGLLRMMQKQTHKQFAEGVTPLKFAPEDGPQFFTRHGWRPAEARSMLKSARKLKRLPFFLWLMSHLPEKPPEQMKSRPWGGACLLEKQ